LTPQLYDLNVTVVDLAGNVNNLIYRLSVTASQTLATISQIAPTVNLTIPWSRNGAAV
jgi:hypothetical protein